MVGPAQQGQIRQVGGAAVEPVAQVVGLAPGQGALAAGEDTAAVADGQGSSLGGRDDPAAAADLQRLAGVPPRTGGSRVIAAWSRAANPPSPPEIDAGDLSSASVSRAAGRLPLSGPLLGP